MQNILVINHGYTFIMLFPGVIGQILYFLPKGKLKLLDCPPSDCSSENIVHHGIFNDIIKLTGISNSYPQTRLCVW